MKDSSRKTITPLQAKARHICIPGCALGILCICAMGLAPLAARSQSLADALDGSGLVWSTGGNANWLAETGTAHDNVDAAQSGLISDNQQTWLQTTVTGPGTVSFWWRVSSEAGWDFLRFAIGGTEKTNISGKVDWTQITLAVPSGSQTLRWSYTKDSSTSANADMGWLDQVAYSPVTVKPSFVNDPESLSVLEGDVAGLYSAASGSPYPAYQWQRFGTNVPGETNQSIYWYQVPVDAAGDYRVIASNVAGSVTSVVATLTVKAGIPIRTLGVWAEDQPGNAMNVVVTNHLAYVANGSNGLAIIDVSSPASCVRVGGWGAGHDVNDVAVAGSYAYLADGSNGLQVISLPDCTRVGGFSFTNGVWRLAVSGNFVYLLSSDYPPTLYIIDASNPANCQFAGAMAGAGNRLAVMGALFMTRFQSLDVVDASDPAHCTLLEALPVDTMGGAIEVKLAQNRAYVTGRYSGLTIFDVSNPTNCTVLGTNNLRNAILDSGLLALSGNLAYVIGPPLQALDVSDPAKIIRAGQYFDLPYSYLITGMAASGHYLYLTLGDQGLKILEVGGLRCLAPFATGPGQPLILRFSHADGTPILAGELPGFQVQFSTDLTHWTNLTCSLTLTNGAAQASDIQGGGATSRFYRVRHP